MASPTRERLVPLLRAREFGTTWAQELRRPRGGIAERMHGLWENVPELARGPLRRTLAPRRFQAFCVGLSRTGTHSLCHMFGTHHRAGHEQNFGLVEAIQGRLQGSLSEHGIERILRQRDDRLWLEMDSANPLIFVIEDLVRIFPEARFVLTVRHVRSWLESRLDNHHFFGRARSQWGATWEARYGQASGHPPEERVLAEHGLFTLDGYLSGWTKHYERALAAVPPERLLVLRTHELSTSLPALADFLSIPVATLDAQRTHGGISPARFHMLDEIDDGYLEQKIQKHCGAMMARFFPECGLLDSPGSSGSARKSVAVHDRSARGSAPRAPVPRVTVVLVPREGFSLTLRTLDGFLAANNPPHRLVVVDGGSPGPLARELRRRATRDGFQLIRTESYLSPNQSRNLGLGVVETEFAAFLDNNVEVAPRWLGELVRCADETGAAAVVPLTLYGGLDGGVHFAGGSLTFKDEDGKRVLHDVLHGESQGLDDVRGWAKTAPSDYVEFHAFLVRTAAARKVGGFDERMLSTREHIDFSLCLTGVGETIYFEPESVVSVTPDRQTWSDLPYFLLRWSEAWVEESERRLVEKWGAGIHEEQLAMLRLHRHRGALAYGRLLRGLRRVAGKELTQLFAERAFFPLEIAANRWGVHASGRGTFSSDQA